MRGYLAPGGFDIGASSDTPVGPLAYDVPITWGPIGPGRSYIVTNEPDAGEYQAVFGFTAQEDSAYFLASYAGNERVNSLVSWTETGTARIDVSANTEDPFNEVTILAEALEGVAGKWAKVQAGSTDADHYAYLQARNTGLHSEVYALPHLAYMQSTDDDNVRTLTISINANENIVQIPGVSGAIVEGDVVIDDTVLQTVMTITPEPSAATSVIRGTLFFDSPAADDLKFRFVCTNVDVSRGVLTKPDGSRVTILNDTDYSIASDGTSQAASFEISVTKNGAPSVAIQCAKVADVAGTPTTIVAQYSTATAHGVYWTPNA